MTNIINGIDVSEEHKNCKYRFKGKSCEDCPLNCKLKRLQEENEELEEKITKFRWDNPYYDLYNNVVGQRDNLKKENEELKKENKNYARLMLEQQEVSRKYWECIEKIKQAIEVLAETCNIYPLKTNLDKLITTINEVLDDN